MRRLRVLLACECSGRVRDEFTKRGWEAWSADILPSETPAHVVTADGENFYQDVVPFGPGFDQIGHHYQGDVTDLFRWNHPVNHERRELHDSLEEWDRQHMPLWDLIIGFPPCTDLSYAGAAWFKQKQADGRQDAAADFFMLMINAPALYVAVENPRGIMFSRYRRPDQTVQPWWFGDPFRKNTCLWLKGLPLLVPKYDKPEQLATVTSGDASGYKLHRTVTSGSTERADAKAGKDPFDFNGRMHYEDSEGRVNRAKVRSRTFMGIAQAMADQWGLFVECELGA